MFTLLKRLTLLVTAVAALAVIAAPAAVSAAAFDVKNNLDCQKAADSAVCGSSTTDDPLSGQNGIIRNVTTIIATIAGIAAVIIIIIGGIRYITSGGDANQVSQAKKTIIFAAIGLVIIVSAQLIINLVISRI